MPIANHPFLTLGQLRHDDARSFENAQLKSAHQTSRSSGLKRLTLAAGHSLRLRRIARPTARASHLSIDDGLDRRAEMFGKNLSLRVNQAPLVQQLE